MRCRMWRPNILDAAKSSKTKHGTNFLGGESRERYRNEITAALQDRSNNAIVVLGEDGDDRVELVTDAQTHVARFGNIVHIIGTTYAQDLRYGALAFLLSDLETGEVPEPAEVMKALSHSLGNGHGPGIVVLQYPQLLDKHSQTVLAQLAYNHGILLVILAEHLGTVPAAFSPVLRGTEHHEVRVEPMLLDETQEMLSETFAANPTPIALSALWQRSRGNPGWLSALTHDTLASGKLGIRDGHMLLAPGPWPSGGRLAAMALSQTAVLEKAERDLLCRLACGEATAIHDLDGKELGALDALIVGGFVERCTTNRDLIEVRSSLLAAELRAALGLADEEPHREVESLQGHFFDFIAGKPLHLRSQSSLGIEESGLCAMALLDMLRKNLLDGHLGQARKDVAKLISKHHTLLPEELFQVVVLAQTILDVIDIDPASARPALESLGAQFAGTGSEYDQWLVNSMRNFMRDDEDPAKHAPLPFDRRWEKGRWWFSELLASRETTLLHKLDASRGVVLPLGESAVLELLVGMRQGFGPYPGRQGTSPNSVDPQVNIALKLMANSARQSGEGLAIIGLETLLEAGFAIFAAPWANRVFEQLSESERVLLTNKLKHRRREETLSSGLLESEFQSGDYPVLEVLTKREKFVATAAAQGLNNQQIAKDAGVSVRTVEGHLYQVYSKLALSGRRDLSALVVSLRDSSDVKA